MFSALRHAVGGAALATAIVTAVLTGAGYFGAVHPALDTIGHLRAHLAVAAVATGIIAILLARGAGRRVTAALAAAAGVAAFVSVASFMLPASGSATAATGAPVYTLLQMNVRFDADLAAAVERIEAERPDVLTVQEVTPEMSPVFEALARSYPHQIVCPDWMPVGGTMILSRRPVIPGRDACRPYGRHIEARIDFDGAAVTIFAEHLAWPWPHDQQDEVTSLVETLTSIAPPAIIAGDFNAAPWSDAVQRYAAASRTTPVRGIGPSWLPYELPAVLRPWLGLPLDNILVSDGIEVVSAGRLTATSSDHLPLLLRFRLTARSGDGSEPPDTSAPGAARAADVQR